MTEGLVPVGAAAVECPDCPWPIYLPIMVDGRGRLVDAEESGVALALRVHARQHNGRLDSNDAL